MEKIYLYPCLYGVMAVGKNRIIISKIQNNGKINVNYEKNIKINKLSNIFLIRGLIFLCVGLYYTFFGIFQTGQSINNEKIDKVSKSLNVSKKSVFVFITIIFSVLFCSILLGFLPLKINYFLGEINILYKRLIIALIKIVIIMILLLFLKFLPVFKEYYAFNYACYKQQKQNKQLNFLEYLVCSIILNTFVISLFGLVANKWYFAIVNILTSLLIFVVNYELLLLIKQYKWANKLLLLFNFVIIQKNSPLEDKCVKIVLTEFQLVNIKRGNMQEKINEQDILFSEAYVYAKDILEKYNKYEKSDLDFIFCEVLGKKRAEIKLVKTISKSDFNAIKKYVQRRADGEPLTKMFGYANFYGLDFFVTKDVLSPRMDTERLVETVLKELKGKQKVLDVGTGSGAIAITIAKLSNAKVTAVDVSEDALKVAQKNALHNNVKVNFVKSDLFDSLGKFAKFDVIVSNPPYIPTADIETLEEEVKKYDPILALDGGEDGLLFYKKIIELAPKRLTKNGRVYFEVGISQAQNVKKLLQKNFKDIRIVKDYNKIDRVVCATLK